MFTYMYNTSYFNLEYIYNHLHPVMIYQWKLTKKLKKALQSSLRNTEIAYFSNQLELFKHDIGKTWKVLNGILGVGGNTCKKTP